jgi:hypothetical protein
MYDEVKTEIEIHPEGNVLEFIFSSMLAYGIYEQHPVVKILWLILMYTWK